MNRRTFLGLLPALSAVPGLVVQTRDDAVEIVPTPTPAAPAAVLTLTFGDVTISSGPDATYQHSAQFPRGRFGGHLGRGEVRVDAVRFRGPVAAWNALIKRYACVTRAAANPPVVVALDGQELMVLDHAILTAATTCWPAGDDPAAEATGSVGLVGIWRAARELLEEHYRAEAAEAERLRALAPPPAAEDDWSDWND